MPLNRGFFPLLCALASIVGPACVESLAQANEQAQPAVQDYPSPPPQARPRLNEPTPADARLDTLLAPIALYPDALLAILLPASTYPGDIAAAARYLAQSGDAAMVDEQPWDGSVRALAHYPAVVSWMASNLEWTTELGRAFAASPDAVMDSVQRLRARALAAGTLNTTDQVQVLDQDGDIEIVPAQPDTLYIPVYDPEVVYSADPYYGYGGPFINFGSPCPAGVWLSYGFDWRRHRVWTGGSQQGGSRSHNFDGDRVPPGARTWHPPAPAQGAPARPGGATLNEAMQPRPMPGAPNPPPEHYKQRPAAGQGPASGNDYPGIAAPPQTRPRLNGPPSPGVPDMTVRQTLSNPPIQNEPPVAESRAEAPPPGAPVRDFAPLPDRAAPEAAPRSVPPAPAAAPHEGAPHESAPHEAAPVHEPAPVQQTAAPSSKNQN